MSSVTESGQLIIDLGALSDNYRQFQSVASGACDIAGVIKANAYGLGLEKVYNALNDLDCPQIFVATLDEAIRLKQHDEDAPVAVLGGLFHGGENEYIEHGITPVLNSPEEIERWRKLAQAQEEALPSFIHFDTGMNRLGLSALEAQRLIDDTSALDGLDLQLIMSHFASADDHEDPLTEKQASAFAGIAAHFPNAKKSLSNSPGLYASEEYHYDLARPGYALYGGNPTPHLENPMNTVVHLKSRILQIRECKKGESIGYGGSYVFEKDTRTATVAIGYADGFLRSHSSDPSKPFAKLYFEGHACNIIGRISMDLVTLDVDHIPNIKAGDWAEVLGHHQSVDDLAKASGTIGYEILTSLGARYKRTYIKA